MSETTKHRNHDRIVEALAEALHTSNGAELAALGELVGVAPKDEDWNDFVDNIVDALTFPAITAPTPRTDG